MKTIIYLLTLCIPIIGLAQKPKDSIMNPQLHLSPHRLIENGIGLNLYYVKNRVAIGVNGSLENFELEHSINSRKLYDHMRSVSLMSGLDLRMDKFISFSLLTGISYVYYIRIENLHPEGGGQSYFGYIPPHPVYDEKLYHLIGGKINLGMNLHFGKRFALQLGWNNDFNRLKKANTVLLGFKWGFKV